MNFQQHNDLLIVIIEKFMLCTLISQHWEIIHCTFYCLTLCFHSISPVELYSNVTYAYFKKNL